MRRSLIAAALLGALIGVVPASADLQEIPTRLALPGGVGAIAGLGNLSAEDCGGPVALEGFSVVGGSWTFTAEIVAQDMSVGCALILGLSVASGSWDPAVGGWIPPAPGSGAMYIGPTATGTHDVAVSICTGTAGCFNGQLSVTRV